jgi:16S rRNA (cytosine967-C5)-methyltransferase
VNGADRVLVDAPCTATGVIRRHPDIKLLRRAADAAGFANTQRQILATAVELLRPGGRLIYCTCSVLPEENEQVVAAYLRDTENARELQSDGSYVPLKAKRQRERVDVHRKFIDLYARKRV